MLKFSPISLSLFVALVCILCSCKNETTTVANRSYVSFRGKTMGTTFSVTLKENNYRNYQYDVDSVLSGVNAALSTYQSNSIISLFNQTPDTFFISKEAAGGDQLYYEYFLVNYLKALEIWKMTNGAFDPTVGQLVNFWGFGSEGRKQIENVDSSEVNELLSHVGFEKLSIYEEEKNWIIIKFDNEIQLDFNALAKGFGVDQVTGYLDYKNVSDYLVEVGGEVRVKGKNGRGELWTVGVSRPLENAAVDDFYATMQLEKGAMASSGNYRNYYIADGKKRFHSINPKTGFPEETSLLGASILANDCMTADALATACMVLGLNAAKSLMLTQDVGSAFLIYETEDGKLDYFATPDILFSIR